MTFPVSGLTNPGVALPHICLFSDIKKKKSLSEEGFLLLVVKSILNDNVTTGFRELGRFDGWN